MNKDKELDRHPSGLVLVSHEASMAPKSDLAKLQRGNSFQFDEFIDNLTDDDSPGEPGANRVSGKVSSELVASGQAVSSASPTIPTSKQSRTAPPKPIKTGFFRRLFSSSSINLTGERSSSLPVNQSGVDPDHDALSHKKSVLFRRPGTSSKKGDSSKALTASRIDPLSQEHGQVSTGEVANSHVPSSRSDVALAPQTVDTSRPLQADDRSPPRHGKASRATISEHDKQLGLNQLTTTDREHRPTSTGSVESDPLRQWSSIRASYFHETAASDADAPPLIRVTVDSQQISPQDASDKTGSGAESDAAELNNLEDTKTILSPDLPPFTVRMERHSDEIENSVMIKAIAMYESQEASMAPENYAAYLGVDRVHNSAVRTAFLGLFDFRGLSVLQSLRMFCSRLYIRGETQVIDRILESFSGRWRQCNPDHKFLTQDITYILAFALITLNTDLYIADTPADQKMRKSAFVQNTLQAIGSQTVSNDVTQISRPLTMQAFSGANEPERSPTEEQTIRYVIKSASNYTLQDEANDTSEQARESHVSQERQPKISQYSAASPLPSTTLVRARSMSQTIQERWPKTLSQARNSFLKELLQEMYTGVKNEQIRQPTMRRLLKRNDTSDTTASGRLYQAASPSIPGSIRSRSAPQSGEMSDNTSVASFDVVSETPVKLTYNGQSSTSRSHNIPFSSQQGSRLSLSSRQGQPDGNSRPATVSNHRGIGFAGSLSNVIIREETQQQVKDENKVSELINEAEEDTLTLSGPPFAKEGRLYHKIVDPTSKRTKGKNWSSELFAVLERGQIRLFDFSTKNRGPQTTFGGGDWTQNARLVLEAQLMQSLASALPEKGYSRDRPHIWKLVLPEGQVHLFEVGTDELVQEWVSTSNYWAARATKEPLLGAVDNAEYGWSDALLPNTVLENGRRPSSSTFSIASSSTNFKYDDSGEGGARVAIRQWEPEPPSLMTSTLSQEAQLRALERFAEKLNDELYTFMTRRPLLSRTLNPRHPNLTKAIANFDKKARYMADEIARYRIYIGALKNGIDTAEAVQAAKQDENLRDLR